MTAISARYVPVLLGLLFLLLLPFLPSRFEVRRADDCDDPEALLDLARLPGSAKQSERWEKYDQEVVQWTVVDLVSGDEKTPFLGVLIRSFRPSDLYTRPPRYVLGSFEAGQREVREVDVDGETVPIQTIRDATHGSTAIASWLFVYEGRAVRHPLLSQLRTAPRQVWSGTRPLSLVAAGGIVPSARMDEAQERLQDWLVAVYRHHRAVCDASRP